MNREYAIVSRALARGGVGLADAVRSLIAVDWFPPDLAAEARKVINADGDLRSLADHLLSELRRRDLAR